MEFFLPNLTFFISRYLNISSEINEKLYSRVTRKWYYDSFAEKRSNSSSTKLEYAGKKNSKRFKEE